MDLHQVRGTLTFIIYIPLGAVEKELSKGFGGQLYNLTSVSLAYWYCGDVANCLTLVNMVSHLFAEKFNLIRRPLAA